MVAVTSEKNTESLDLIILTFTFSYITWKNNLIVLNAMKLVH